MTYFGVLLWFIAIPTVVLIGVTLYDRRRGRGYPDVWHTLSPWVVLFAHIVVALVYTTPWDNYLVATGVWWYDPQQVTGLTLGWVPIEEYTFFVVQTLMTGLWLLTWMRHLQPPRGPPPLRGAARWTSTVALGLLWICALVVLVIGWLPGWYMALILIWALPPIMLQWGFGADILWRYRRLVLVGLLPPTLYLWAVDAIAIGAGVWTINPKDILRVYLGGVLPLEEATFFLVTNALVVFGMTLVLARDSFARVGKGTLVRRITERQA